MLGSPSIKGEPHAYPTLASDLSFLALAILAAIPFANCATTSHTLPASAISPWKTGFTIALWLEDRCESQETDDKSVTVLEAIHDGVIWPIQALSAIGAVTVASAAWAVYDRLSLPWDSPLPNRAEQIAAFVMPHRAGPVIHDAGSRSRVPVVWTACLPYDDS
jgi:hypothetical protein